MKSKINFLITLLGLICILTLTGCGGVKLYPILDNNIIAVKQGEQFTAPRDGYFLSVEYVERVLEARVERGF